MPGGNNLINLGDLAKPAEVLVNRVSDAIGGIAKPWQIERVAKAEARAELIKAQARVEVSEIEQRAILRMVREEGKKQENIEAVTLKSLEYLNENAEPEIIDEDWLVHFFEKARSYSDDDTQKIWAKILAGEANASHSFSTRTIDMLSSMDAHDADLFTKVCGYLWNMASRPFLIVPDMKDDHFNQSGLTFDDLVHLEYAGLIAFQPLSGFRQTGFPEITPFVYFDKLLVMRFPPAVGTPSKPRSLAVGPALLTRAGSELSRIVEAKPLPEYLDWVVKEWNKAGLKEISAEELLDMAQARAGSQNAPTTPPST